MKIGAKRYADVSVHNRTGRGHVILHIPFVFLFSTHTGATSPPQRKKKRNEPTKTTSPVAKIKGAKRQEKDTPSISSAKPTDSSNERNMGVENPPDAR